MHIKIPHTGAGFDEFVVKVKKLAFENNKNRFYVTFKPTMGPGGTPGGMSQTRK